MALKKIQLVTNCGYCKEKKTPDFMNATELNKFLSERGKIQPRSRTSLCAKHQRKVTDAVKRARYIAVLPFTVTAD
jgi:small subunit ribosomal protein S18